MLLLESSSPPASADRRLSPQRPDVTTMPSVTQLSDGDLATSFVAGEPEALRRIFDEEQRAIYSYCRRFVEDHAADVTQEVFLAAWRSRHRFDPAAGSLGGWLMGIARFKVLDHVRGRYRDGSTPSADLVDHFADGGAGEREIDLVVASHGDEDHVAGLAGLAARMQFGETATNGLARDTEAWTLLRSRSGPPVALSAGDAFVVDHVRFTVLWPPGNETGEAGRNDLSLVLRVEYGETSVLLTGDIERGAQRALLTSGALLGADVLKVPHHGAATSEASFFDAVRPQAAVISVGSGNRFGHPAEETIDAIGEALILRTDQDGRIRLRSDGLKWTVKTER